MVLSEELWRNVRGTRLGGIGRNRQAKGEFKGRSGGKVGELCGFLSIPPVHCSGELQGLSGELQGLFRMRGNCKDSLSCGGIARTSLQGNCGGSLGEAGGAWTS